MKPQPIIARDASDGVDAAVRRSQAAVQVDPASFENEKFQKLCRTSWWSDWLLRYPLRVIRTFRWLAQFFGRPPIFSVPFTKWVFVLGYEEVREVLSRDVEFPVPWGRRMEDLTDGENFVLGMPRNLKYQLSYAQLAHAFPREDVPRKVVPLSAQATQTILARKRAQGILDFDAIQDLITAVPTELCESYYGIDIPDKVAFAKWTLAVSTYTFGPSDTADRTALAKAGAALLTKAIRDSIAAHRLGGRPGTAISRLLAMQTEDPAVTDNVIHAHLFGMVLGWIPTNVLAGGNMLETLLRFPKFMERARAAAQANDDDLLWRCLREALRFRHINPAPWRICSTGYNFQASGYRVRPDSKVVASIQSAMFDSDCIERPTVFDPARRDEDYMVFGFGQHWCLGAYIAIAQLTETFKGLLTMARKLEAVDNRRVRTTRFNDLFPVGLRIRLVP